VNERSDSRPNRYLGDSELLYSLRFDKGKALGVALSFFLNDKFLEFDSSFSHRACDTKSLLSLNLPKMK
jgi:hypothetical protein